MSGPLTFQLYQAIAHHGPMTARDLAKHLNADAQRVASTLGMMTKQQVLRPMQTPGYGRYSYALPED